MKLARLFTLNWGNLESREWQLADMTLLVGESGSGKTSLLDAIQTVLTATRGGVFFYNPGQEETTQGSRTKEKRTLADYCLGREGQAFARDSAHTYLAAVFEPSGEERGTPLTAIVAAEALVVGNKAELSKLGLFIVRRRALTIDQFLATEANGNGNGELHLIETRQFWPHLQRVIGREEVEFFNDDKGLFLRHLYGAFRGQKHVDEQEAVRAARSLVKAIAYKPAGSIDTLVREELLEEDDISEDLRKVGVLLRDMRDLADEASRLSESIAKLRVVRSEGDKSLETVAEMLVYNAARSQRMLLRHEDELVRKQGEISTAGGEIKRLLGLIEVNDKRIAQLSSSEHQLRASLAQNPTWNQKEGLEKQISDAENRLGSAIASTSAWLDGLTKLVEEGTFVERLAPAQLPPGLVSARAAVVATLGPVRRFSARRLATVFDSIPGNGFSPDTALEAADQVSKLEAPAAALWDALLRGETNFATALEHERIRLQVRVDELANREESVVAQLKGLSEGRSALPDHIQRGYDLLRSTLPLANAQVLCELVEPKPNTPWQNAIEGFMGRDRYAVLVEENCEAQASEFVRHKLEARSRLKIIQGRRARRDARDAPPGSIVEELTVAHPTALAYLLGAYGNVTKVSDTQTLTGVSRGITLQGIAANAFGIYSAYAEDHDLVFGVEARRRRQQALEEELSEARSTKRKLEEDIANQRQLAFKLRRLALNGSANAAVEVWQFCQERFDALEALGRIDLKETTTLQATLDEVLDQAKVLREANAKHQTEQLVQSISAKSAGERVIAIQQALPGLKVDVASAGAKFAVLEDASAHRVQIAPLIARAEALAQDRLQSDAALQSRCYSVEQEVPQRLADFIQALGEYQLKAREVERVHYERERLRLVDFEPGVRNICTVLSDVDRQLNQQERFGLAENLTRLQQAENTFHHVFTSDFCFRIRSKVANGVDTLRELNRELEHLVFGGDRFVIEWSWVAQYQDYYKFFDAVHARAEEFGQRNIFEADVLTSDLAKVRDELKALLLSSDRDTAQKRLKELADYRNYRRYEIYRESATGGRTALSTWGTGSGGQLETPFYVVRSAVLSSALRFFGKGSSQLRLMLSDEAFAKMDESRRRSVIRYLHETLKVQLIVAMPTANAASVKPEFEREFTFARVAATLGDGREWFAFEAQDKTLKRAALVAQWDVAEREARELARTEFEARYPGSLDAATPETARVPAPPSVPQPVTPAVDTPPLSEVNSRD